MGGIRSSLFLASILLLTTTVCTLVVSALDGDNDGIDDVDSVSDDDDVDGFDDDVDDGVDDDVDDVGC